MSQLEQVVAFATPGKRETNSAYGDIDVAVSFRRTFAALFDYSLLAVVLISLVRTYGLLTHNFTVRLPFYHQVPLIPKYWSITVWYTKAPAILLFFAIMIAYFAVFEAALGWSPGKLLFGIRVVDFYGGMPTVGQALVRNLFRVLDAYPFVVPNLVGLAIVLSNRRRQRGGDKAAGTLVVDHKACSAVQTVRRWEARRKATELSLPDEVWT